MNNVLHIKASSMFLPNQISLPASLRWLRRTLTILLILSNLAITIWANTSR
jgi:hypothetical protein